MKKTPDKKGRNASILSSWNFLSMSARARWIDELGTLVGLPYNSYKPITNTTWVVYRRFSSRIWGGGARWCYRKWLKVTWHQRGSLGCAHAQSEVGGFPPFFSLCLDQNYKVIQLMYLAHRSTEPLLTYWENSTMTKYCYIHIMHIE
jgi:hypothetical protein